VIERKNDKMEIVKRQKREIGNRNRDVEKSEFWIHSEIERNTERIRNGRILKNELEGQWGRIFRNVEWALFSFF